MNFKYNYTRTLDPDAKYIDIVFLKSDCSTAASSDVVAISNMNHTMSCMK